MKEFALIIHFIGLAMGLGTSLAFMFLGIAASKMEKKEALKFQSNTLALSRMGQIGLVLLTISGLYLMAPYWGALPSNPLMIAKLALAIVLILLIMRITAAGNKSQSGDAENQLKKTTRMGKLALLTALSIVVVAVFVFH
ncbi:MAG: hypothetical protein IPL49_19175 [Saprospirales bacterium]|nr:hypothetical protein [Saprospirales bacterium]MBK8492947.1 hypothetical protein [Saprospirales bacterium]